jgi:hypothetical protein
MPVVQRQRCAIYLLCPTGDQNPEVMEVEFGLEVISYRYSRRAGTDNEYRYISISRPGRLLFLRIPFVAMCSHEQRKVMKMEKRKNSLDRCDDPTGP